MQKLTKLFGARVDEPAFEDLYRAVAVDPKKFPDFGQGRIFPGHFAPIVVREQSGYTIRPMRYSAFPPSFIADPSRYTTYNARRDNLGSPFWKEMTGVHHGLLVVTAFYEWVKVADLLRAGVVNIEAVKADFARQSENRKAKVLASGKPYKPTPTELKDPRFRDIVICFQAGDQETHLVVPVIFSYGELAVGTQIPLKTAGFALITDDPPAEVRKAGHDRCPISLPESAWQMWLAGDLNALKSCAWPAFTHRLPKAS